MIVRQGFFEGRIKPGQEEAFYAYVRDIMMDVWRAFPGLVKLEVSTAHSPEDKKNFPLHTSFTFPDETTLQQALTSPQRQTSLEKTLILMQMFDGRIFHVVTTPLSAS